MPSLKRNQAEGQVKNQTWNLIDMLVALLLAL